MWMQQWTRDVVRFVTFSLSVVSWIANGFSIRLEIFVGIARKFRPLLQNCGTPPICYVVGVRH
uniref:Secreted protein n=1 Tax=Parascaris univalens TaxID=6257 RepID=A0A915A0J1_PARUN